MKKRKQLLVPVLIAITLMTSTTAQAGLWSNDVQSIMMSGQTTDDGVTLVANAMVAATSPVSGAAKTVRKNYLVEVSAYTSEVAQTDDSPFITANGTHVRDGIVATNMFPFGTVLKIPSLFGDKIFVVEDRMNKRYQKNVDVWFADKDAALKLGRRLVSIEVIK
jgi:3D (Asp-Asp-Asp) domain-containing protein